MQEKVTIHVFRRRLCFTTPSGRFYHPYQEDMKYMDSSTNVQAPPQAAYFL